jgi:hypothetical protein
MSKNKHFNFRHSNKKLLSFKYLKKLSRQYYNKLLFSVFKKYKLFKKHIKKSSLINKNNFFIRIYKFFIKLRNYSFLFNYSNNLYNNFTVLEKHKKHLRNFFKVIKKHLHINKNALKSNTFNRISFNFNKLVYLYNHYIFNIIKNKRYYHLNKNSLFYFKNSEEKNIYNKKNIKSILIKKKTIFLSNNIKKKYHIKKSIKKKLSKKGISYKKAFYLKKTFLDNESLIYIK